MAAEWSDRGELDSRADRRSMCGRFAARLVRAGIVLFIAVLLTGCVNRWNARNYRPLDDAVNKNYQECEAQAKSGTEGCMYDRGYRLREMTDGEILVAIVTAPLWIPLRIFFFYTKFPPCCLGANDKAN